MKMKGFHRWKGFYMMTIPELITRAMAYDHGDARRIQHFLKVYTYADIIGQLEGLAPQELETLRVAAILHDIGIHEAEKNTVARQGISGIRRACHRPGHIGRIQLPRTLDRSCRLSHRPSPHLYRYRRPRLSDSHWSRFPRQCLWRQLETRCHPSFPRYLL